MFAKILIRTVQFVTFLTTLAVIFSITRGLINQNINYLLDEGLFMFLICLLWAFCAVFYVNLGNKHYKNLPEYKEDYFFYNFKWFEIKSLSVRRILGILSSIQIITFICFCVSLILFAGHIEINSSNNNDLDIIIGLGLIVVLGLLPFIINVIIKYSYKLILWVKG